MASTFRDMFALCTIAVLCLMPVSHSAPLDCTDLLKPFDQLNPLNMEGTWIMVADSLKNVGDVPVAESDSVSVEFYNSTIIRTNRYGTQCRYSHHNVSIDGAHYGFNVEQIFNITGTIYQTSCADCIVLSFKVETPISKTEEFCLFSKNREVDEKYMKEFNSQVECLNMPKAVVMDPTVPLCPILPLHRRSS